MALKAFVLVTEAVVNNGDNEHMDVSAKVRVLGAEMGDLQERYYNMDIQDVDPTTLAGFKAVIAAAVKSDMQGHGITFTPITDTILVY